MKKRLESDEEILAPSESDGTAIYKRGARSWWFSYIVLMFAVLNVIFLGGKRRAFGIFVAKLHHGEFKDTWLAELNWIGDSYAALGYISTTASTALIIRFNKRYRWFQFIGSLLILIACISSAAVPNAHWLFLTHTVFHGLGSGLILSVVGLIVGDYFDKSHPRHILATTLVSGGSVASILFVEFYAFLIESYGWRQSFIILGIVYFIINCSACFVFSSPQRVLKHKELLSSVAPSVKRSQSWWVTIKDNCRIQRHSARRFAFSLLLLWMIDRVLTSIVTYGMLLNLADFMRRNQTDLHHSTSLTVMFAAGEAATYLTGAIITVFTLNWLHDRLRYILLVSTFLMSISLMVWEFVAQKIYTFSATSHGISDLLAFISGLCLGPSITFLFPAGEELTGLPGHMAYPFSLFGMGIGMALSPLLSAVIAQLFDYNWYFLVQGCIIFIKFICLCASCILISIGGPPGSAFRHLYRVHNDSDNNISSSSGNSSIASNCNIMRNSNKKEFYAEDADADADDDDDDENDDYNDGYVQDPLIKRKPAVKSSLLKTKVVNSGIRGLGESSGKQFKAEDCVRLLGDEHVATENDEEGENSVDNVRNR